MAVRTLVMTTVICVCITLVLGGCDMFSPEAKKAKHRERAMNYFEKAQYQEALIEYKNVSQVDPKDADVHYKLALTYLKLGGMTNLQNAFTEFSKTVELDKEGGFNDQVQKSQHDAA